MEKSKTEQIRDKVYDYMLSVDLSTLSLNDLVTYITALKALEESNPFLSGFRNALGTASSTPSI